jgi:tyrosyl-tRNA synthetase
LRRGERGWFTARFAMTILDELRWRGMLADCTDLDALTRRLSERPITLYAGFDPTSDSLHVGNLVPLFALRRFQLHGHHPIALAGGSTGMIGDPSGKSDERNLLTPEQLEHHLACIKPQLARFLDFEYAGWDGPAKLVCDFFCQPALPAPASLAAAKMASNS